MITDKIIKAIEWIGVALGALFLIVACFGIVKKVQLRIDTDNGHIPSCIWCESNNVEVAMKYRGEYLYHCKDCDTIFNYGLDDFLR